MADEKEFNSAKDAIKFAKRELKKLGNAALMPRKTLEEDYRKNLQELQEWHRAAKKMEIRRDILADELRRLKSVVCEENQESIDRALEQAGVVDE